MIYFKYYFPLLPVFLETHKTPLCYHSGAYISIYPRTGRLERPVPFWGLCAAVRREHPHTRSLQPALQPVFRLGVGLHITLCLQPLSPSGQTAAFPPDPVAQNPAVQFVARESNSGSGSRELVRVPLLALGTRADAERRFPLSSRSETVQRERCPNPSRLGPQEAML